ncbi:unnamed protein product [Rotaria magnacalcarata]
MNHDNRLDIVVVNYGTDNLLVFFGKGDGTFSQSNLYPTGPNSTPFGVLIADFNDDNYLDIATANTSSNNITYTIGSSSQPFAACVGDLNQDTILDLIVANYGSKSDSTPTSAAVGDINNDTRPDLIIAHYSIDSIGVFLGNGDGTFASETVYSAGYNSRPTFVALADLNGDDRLDVAVVLNNYFSVGIFFGYYNSPFTVPAFYSSSSMLTPFALTAAYFDNNSRLDLVATAYDDGILAVYLQFENGTFQSSTIYDTGNNTGLYSVAVGDFNNDSRIDIIVGNYHSDNIALFLEFRNGSFRSAISYSTELDFGPYSVLVGDFNNDDRLDGVGSNSQPTALVVGDLNNDTRLDIVVINYSAVAIGVFLGNGDGTFSSQTEYYTGYYYSCPWGLALTDFNNDVLLDIAVCNQCGYNLGIFIVKGDGKFSDQTTYPTGLNSLPTGIDVGDFNNDHHMDIALVNYEKCSTGSLSGSYWVFVGDFNKDGNLDFVAALSLSGGIGVCFGDGNGSFSNIALFRTGTATYPCCCLGDIGGVVTLWGDQNRIFLVPITYSTGLNASSQALAISDFNKDQHLDVAATYSKSSSVGLFFGYGNGSLSNEVTYSTAVNSQSRSIAVGDLNNDTILDIVVTNSNTNNIGVLLGLGNETFKNLTTYPTDTLADPVSIAIVDLNKDNNLDVAVTNNRANSINIFQGNGDGHFRLAFHI